MSVFKTLLLLLLSGIASQSVIALDTQREDVAAFIDELVNDHNFDREALTTLLTEATRKDNIIEAISRPAEKAKAWHEYRDIFIQPKRIKAGVAFWDEHAATINAVSADTGVPGEILVGIIGVETFYGRITGNYRVLDALATLGFDYPPRSKFFRRELKEFLLLAREEQVNPREALGSYAGAMGSPQFIPSSYRAYSVDSDGDGRRDLFGSWHDIIGSVANYFVRHRWESGKPVASDASFAADFHGVIPKKNSLKPNSTVAVLRHSGITFDDVATPDAAARLIAFEGKDSPEYHIGYKNFYVITRYNRSAMYAMAVWQLGNEVAAARNAQIAAKARE